MEGSEQGRPSVSTDPDVESHYREIAEKIVHNTVEKC